MPQKYLHLEEQEISKRLRRNTLAAGFLTLTGFSLLIPAFSVAGSRLDYQEFCFKPPVVHSQSAHQYCVGSKIRKGVSWRVALERSNSQVFKSKVTLLNHLPAQNPNAGIYGLCAAGFFGAAYFFMRHGTEQLESNLDLVVANKQALVLERSLEQTKHLNIQTLKTQQEEEFFREILNREHGSAMYDLVPDGERELAAHAHHKSEELRQAAFNLDIANLQAGTAEALEKQAKHEAEAAKLHRSPEKPGKGGPCEKSNESAKSELIERLKSHEGGWLYTVVMSNKPVFLIGSQGSWKSYCSATIALCRYYLKGQKIASITDPHFNKNAEDAWKELSPLEPDCYGGAQDWVDVAEGIQAGFERWNSRTLKDEPLTSIWDEQTNWALHEECLKGSKEFMGRVISDPRKSNEAPLVITHSFSNAGTGGGSGFAQAREEGVLQLWLNSDNEMKPLFKGKLVGFKNEEGELIEEFKITIPKEWFNPEAITKLFKP